MERWRGEGGGGVGGLMEPERVAGEREGETSPGMVNLRTTRSTTVTVHR